MRLSDIRRTLNSWIPEKSRVVLSTFFDIIDWTTDGFLTVALIRAAGSENACLNDEEFSLSFCKDGGGIQTLASLCIVAFVLGTVGMIATLHLRRKELKLLLFSDRDETHFVPSARGTKQGSFQRTKSRGNEANDPEVLYRQVARLRARRSGKYASLLTLVLEDALMFVVNGILFGNVRSVGALPALVLTTSTVASMIKIFLVSELPGLLKDLRAIEDKFQDVLQDVSRKSMRLRTTIEAEDRNRESFHHFFDENDAGDKVSRKYAKMMKKGLEVAHRVQPLLFQNPQPIIAKLQAGLEAMRECQHVIDELSKEQGAPHEVSSAAFNASVGALQFVWALTNHAKTQASPTIWSPILRHDCVNEMGELLTRLNAGYESQAIADSGEDAVERESPLPHDGSLRQPNTDDENEDALKAKLKAGLKELGLTKNKKSVKKAPSKKKKKEETVPKDGSPLSEDLRCGPSPTMTDTAIPSKEVFLLRRAAKLGSTLKELTESTEYGDRIAAGVLKSFDVSEKDRKWLIRSHMLMKHFRRFARIRPEQEESATRSIRNNFDPLMLYLSSLDRVVLEKIWEWDGGGFQETFEKLRKMQAELATGNINYFVSGLSGGDNSSAMSKKNTSTPRKARREVVPN